MTKPRHFTFEKDQRNGGILFDGDKIKVGEKIHVREVREIDWAKVWSTYWDAKDSQYLYEDDKMLIQQLVEKQLKGEE